MQYRFNIIFFCLVMVQAVSLCARPDVIFTDSDKYNGSYLKHSLMGNKIKFLLSQDVPQFSLPDEYFSVNKLITFLDEKYVFTNEDLKIEFLRMMRMSIESQFTLQEFITELTKFLSEFKIWLDKGKGEEGCSTTSTSYSSLLLLSVGLLFRIIRARSAPIRGQ